jgi:hypothetical protein
MNHPPELTGLHLVGEFPSKEERKKETKGKTKGEAVDINVSSLENRKEL